MNQGGEFSVRPADMQSVAPTFSKESGDLKTALDTLKKNLGSVGAPWGDDKQGKQFSDAYTPPHDQLITAIGVLVQGLQSINDGLAAHADNHTGADQYVKNNLPI
ncbi:WXG100 family type VII secretion target [Kitasatospora sp. NBC_01287]|uniref:WXG100 family type VII secretion target n=1 Tax=Kitasatospora sp. NBC_01287 TaxID=2903573 RepID=UPI00224D7235|nr:WXG100 family type VII secretion target [Kitasatospora sp. NBC_01287]MCX4745569.1 WXG100 family type VII secretion target [Kitasatospora sp. NBC_01287]